MVDPRVGIFLSPLNTNDGFYLSYRNLPPGLKAAEIATHHSDEIKRQLLNATEPVVSTLVGNRKFMEYLTLTDIGR